MCKLGSVNERPHLAGSVSNHDQSWAESGDRFLIRMFRAYLFRQVQDGQSWLELSHIVAALNKVNAIVYKTFTNNFRSWMSDRRKKSCYNLKTSKMWFLWPTKIWRKHWVKYVNSFLDKNLTPHFSVFQWFVSSKCQGPARSHAVIHMWPN